MRYQILNPSLPFLVAYSFVMVFIRQQFNSLSLFPLAISFVVILLSVTRSWVITVIFLLIGFMVVMSALRMRDIINYCIGAALLTLVLSLPAWGIANQFRPGIVEKWVMRLATNPAKQGIDLTFLTRMAEYKDQWDLLTNDIQSLMLGRGLGSSFTWNKEYVKRIQGLNPAFPIIQTPEWATSHSMWMYSLYSGGLLFGWIVPVVFLLSLLRSAAVAHNQKIIPVSSMKRVATLPFFVLLAYLGQTLTANPFNFRFSGLILGLMFGMANWFYDQNKIDTDVQARVGDSRTIRRPIGMSLLLAGACGKGPRI